MIAEIVVFLVKVISGATVRWQGCAPDPRQRIYFANHTSHLDAVLLWAALPPQIRALTRPVAARDYWSANGLRRRLATQVFHSVLIEREKISAHDSPVDHLIEALGQTHSLILFPEGGRGRGPEVQPFKSGLYHLAKRRPDIELVPVLIDNLNRILPKGEVLPVPLLSGISFGTPLRWQEGETKPEFLERTRSALVHLRNA
jgi:1-acyl-sn-glycerol-3-phosphate acyltransferase